MIKLTKGQKIDLTKENPTLAKIVVGLGWDTQKYQGGYDFDLDVSAFMMGVSGKVEQDENFIFYNNRTDAAGSVIHSGDNRTGAESRDGKDDDEQIKVDLKKVPANIDRIMFSITIHEAVSRKQNFGQVSNAYVRLFDEETNNDLLRFELGEDFSVETAVNACEIYRHNGEWKFSAVGSGFQGGLAVMCRNVGLDV